MSLTSIKKLFIGCSLMIAMTVSAMSLQEQAIGISKELRDPSAVNQSLYESNAPQAAQLKAKIYELLKEGKNKEEIFKYFADRYGSQIRYLPELEGSTMALWIVPAGLILLVGVAAGVLFIKRKKVIS